MKKIDRLMNKAKKMIATVELFSARVTQTGDTWTATALLWDGEEGHPQQEIEAVRPTQEAALQFIEELTDRYPNGMDIGVIVTNYYW